MFVRAQAPNRRCRDGSFLSDFASKDFDPRQEETRFRVAVTDHASDVLCPLICRMVLPKADKVPIEFVAFGDQTFDAIEKGRLDLMLNADDGYLLPRLPAK
jgi:hypothetical protein